jgi:hypothetical protein
VTALMLARGRAHHHLGSIISEDKPESGRSIRRTYEVLPVPDEERHQTQRYVENYRRRLSEQPLLDVFDRLEPKIRPLAYPADAAAS